ncbi:hypothetical protein Arnit_2153 [Arcobacter nitrofigilis DSM 7299]|uniref:Uncharacterized protein n=1 Tax=Arcobacter nitrofigilis (strain ATCC 33309 / DSM 7299 / CCUG 15893 / LMG 7604 / NCTC 12251 / CI) TaxID=572480 RepID=D5V0J4_ARCNC|nr:hypothetical protein Arnit_2153 [Arcobacter nitrofigilis DSM 7299]
MKNTQNKGIKKGINKIGNYLHPFPPPYTDINKMEKILYKIPEFKRNNL